MFEGFERQIEALRVGQAAIFQAVYKAAVIAGIYDNRHIFVVFRRRTHHGGAADVDVFNGIGQRATGFGNGCRERIQVDGDQINWVDAVFSHDRAIQITTAQNAAMNFGVQCLNAAIHHFWETGVISHFHGSNAVIAQQFEGATSGEDFDAKGSELTGKVNNASLIGHTNEGAAHRKAGGLVGHLGFHQDGLGAAHSTAREWS